MPTDLADVRERERVAEIEREVGCVCWCDLLEWDFECAPPLCIEASEATPVVGEPAQPLEPGAERELEWSGDKRDFDERANCLYRVGYRTGTSITASLCWDDEDPGARPHAAEHCLQQTFPYGEPLLELVIPGSEPPSSDEDAATGDEDAGAVGDDDGGA